MRRECSTQSRGVAETAKKVRLGDICQIEAGNSAPQNKSFYQKGEYPFVRTSDVGAIHFGVLESTRDLLNKNGIHGLRLFKSGGILFPKSGASTFLNHRVLLGMDAYVSSHLAIITPNSDFVDVHYLLHGLSTIDTKEIFPNTDYPSLRTSDIADITIRLPGIGFQKRIAAVLDKICELKKNAETRLEKLDLLVKSRFVEMFGGPKLTDMLHPLVPIGELFNVGSSKRVFQKDWRSEGVPFYRAREVVKLSRDGHVDNELFISEEMFADYARQYGLPKPNDILVTGVGTLGVCYVVQKGDRFYYKDGNIICLNSKGLIDSTFVYHCYQQQFVRDQIDKNALGSTVGTYTIDSARKTLVPLPPPALQHEFAAFVAKVDKLREAARQTMKAMDTLYRAKLQEFFG